MRRTQAGYSLALGALVPVWDNHRARGGRPGHGWARGTERKLGLWPSPAPGFPPWSARPPEDGPIVGPSCLLFRLRLHKPLTQYPAPSHRADRRRTVTPSPPQAGVRTASEPLVTSGRSCGLASSPPPRSQLRGPLALTSASPSAQGTRCNPFGGRPRPAAQGRDSRRMRGRLSSWRRGARGWRSAGPRRSVCLSLRPRELPGRVWPSPLLCSSPGLPSKI